MRMCSSCGRMQWEDPGGRGGLDRMYCSGVASVDGHRGNILGFGQFVLRICSSFGQMHWEDPGGGWRGQVLLLSIVHVLQ